MGGEQMSQSYQQDLEAEIHELYRKFNFLEKKQKNIF
jgi:hypothetical protein